MFLRPYRRQSDNIYHDVAMVILMRTIGHESHTEVKAHESSPAWFTRCQTSLFIYFMLLFTFFFNVKAEHSVISEKKIKRKPGDHHKSILSILVVVVVRL